MICKLQLSVPIQVERHSRSSPLQFMLAVPMFRVPPFPLSARRERSGFDKTTRSHIPVKDRKFVAALYWITCQVVDTDIQMIGVKGCLTILELDIPLQPDRRGSSRFPSLRHRLTSCSPNRHGHHSSSSSIIIPVETGSTRVSFTPCRSESSPAPLIRDYW
jgi:hypothetical protein